MQTVLPRLAFAGIGLMGLPMCQRLLAAGYPLIVWNRNKFQEINFCNISKGS